MGKIKVRVELDRRNMTPDEFSNAHAGEAWYSNKMYGIVHSACQQELSKSYNVLGQVLQMHGTPTVEHPCQWNRKFEYQQALSKPARLLANAAQE